jgi:cell wall-associated NlpC family hydrolase
MRRRAALASLALLLAACATPPQRLPEDRRGAQVVLAALNFLYTPYRLGGNSAETGFDCSGFTRHIYQQSLGVVLPRSADEQAAARGWVDVGRDALQPGDLVFFNTLGRTFSHVGIVVGDGRFIHAPRTGAQVRVERLQAAYWARRYTGGRRLANP